jgi:hypothetical protein
VFVTRVCNIIEHLSLLRNVMSSCEFKKNTAPEVQLVSTGVKYKYCAYNDTNYSYLQHSICDARLFEKTPSVAHYR